MISNSNIQAIFFKAIKEKLGANYSLVHEISELLKISYDSAYRRLRGEKSISMQEAIELAKHFDISFDELLNNDSNYISFKHYPVQPGKFSGLKWLDFIYYYINLIHQHPFKEIVYAAKDPPIFQYFQFPEIAAFKFFFWGKTLFSSAELEDKKFDVRSIHPEIEQKCKHISNISTKIPTTEIWNEDTFRILMRQIEYYWVSGYFKGKDDLSILLDKIEIWLEHNKKEAELGMRFLIGEELKGIENSYTLYENEVVLNDNTIHVSCGDTCSVFMTYNVLGLLVSSNPDFCMGIENFQKAILSKSNLISQVGEKERNRFFNKLHMMTENFRATHGV
ncbi:helix-turn-helix domain-containing protein [Plebeiibacterium marinum]|uniref:Helix-turn-helix transcriptional regulator n=1 Tax=Plebeiibacterium marinum TaxID=2992111 RepID=A0AAE3MDP8_9BACT|nr:helix-turn-helix transcriptional regulator [Plebeiobacterium marinum]MCW3805849.1 helix-turn-helix transcriptional regulator [Plebeiobacterium marinum]